MIRLELREKKVVSLTCPITQGSTCALLDLPRTWSEPPRQKTAQTTRNLVPEPGPSHSNRTPTEPRGGAQCSRQRSHRRQTRGQSQRHYSTTRPHRFHLPSASVPASGATSPPPPRLPPQTEGGARAPGGSPARGRPLGAPKRGACNSCEYGATCANRSRSLRREGK